MNVPPPEIRSPEVLAAVGDIFGWVWLLALAVWGGLSSYVTRIRKSKVPFSLMELIGECSVSGFSGTLTAVFCVHLKFDFWLIMFLAGLSGHMGGRAIGMAEDYFSEKAKRILP